MKTVSCILTDQMTSVTSLGLLRLQKFSYSILHIILTVVQYILEKRTQVQSQV